MTVNKTVAPDFVRALLKSRGPDHFSVLKKDNLQMFHSRLSITGEKGAQPFSTPNQDCWFLVNGEFYDHQRLKTHFSDYPFELDSDSEVIAPLYQQYGVSANFFEALNGEYAFVIVDRPRQKLILARDPFGVKPLYYSVLNDQVFIGSEAKFLMPFVNRGWDYSTLRKVLSFQYHDTHSTLFKGVEQVPPGMFCEIDLATLKIEKHSVPSSPATSIKCSKSVSQDDVLDSLERAVNRRTQTDKPIAYTLSGGIDSSSIAALGNKPKGSKAFSVSFKNGGQYDEIELADAMASDAGLAFDPLIVDESMLINHLEQAITASEGISINSHVAAKYMMYQRMNEQGFKLSISGEGADEMFAGYTHFNQDMGFSNENAAHLKGMHLPQGEHLSAQMFEDKMGFVPTFVQSKLSMGHKMASLLNPEFMQGFEADLSDLLEHSDFEAKTKLMCSQTLWQNTCFSNYILNTLGDRLEMAHSIEGRVPFLDKEMVSMANQLTDSDKINARGEKDILRQALKKTVPDFIYNQQKQPFVSPPLIDWGQNHLFVDYMETILQDDLFKNSPIFDIQKINNLLTTIRHAPSELRAYDNVLMILVSLYTLNKTIVEGDQCQ